MPGLNRRTFLASAGAGTAALGLAGPSVAFRDSDKLRFAVIGIRGRGGSHISAFCGHSKTTVATLCDVDTREFAPRVKYVEEKTGSKPKVEQDLRRVFDDKSIDAVSIATTNHWHALATVWAVQAGKDVYVEKPVSHNFVEGRKMVEAARKYGKIVQTGTQNRSLSGVMEGVAQLRAGKIGDIYRAKGLCYKPRGSIGKKADAEVPAGVDYNLWLGPAPERPFNPNRFHYEWHWNWDYGNGDLGNQGIHQMDVARWGLGKDEWPTKIESSGGRYGYSDDGQTPNTQICTYRWPDCELVFEVRGLRTNDELGIKVGNIFYGTKGILTFNGDDWTIYDGKPGGKLEKVASGNGGGDHFGNFVEAVLARDPKILHADILEGHRSSALCHLGNIAYRTGQALDFDPKAENFGSNDKANDLLSREYRKPFVMPDRV
ncbi:MAG: Gfo/Idh/MocA family oxidoreductase [Isosphaeraceae bacterium]|nr:Gfo/Idh/MocA family oxidoreductase [Isosphaeraceae bacterium]